MSEQAKSSEVANPKVTASGDMLTAHLLAMLKGWSAYGYELAKRLEESGMGPYNKGTIYRSLRHMEDVGLVSSVWDTSKDGPARRIYSMTDNGDGFLNKWLALVDMHRDFISNLMSLNPMSPHAAANVESHNRAE